MQSSKTGPKFRFPAGSRPASRPLEDECQSEKVSQFAMLPDLNPPRNHCERCSDVPWVNESGLTCPVVMRCSLSSPTAAAAARPSSTSPDSKMLRWAVE
jgi:hypothetical protein